MPAGVVLGTVRTTGVVVGTVVATPAVAGEPARLGAVVTATAVVGTRVVITATVVVGAGVLVGAGAVVNGSVTAVCSVSAELAEAITVVVFSPGAVKGAAASETAKRPPITAIGACTNGLRPRNARHDRPSHEATSITPTG